jgi:hypothetical protein
MTKDEALDLALDALDDLLYWDNGKPEYDKAREAITAIKQARALDKMAENARELGLDYEPVWDNLPSNKDVEDAMRMKRLNQLATSPATPVQEPVAFKIYKPTPPQGAAPNVRDAELPWVYDQDPSSGNVASMWVTPVKATPPAAQRVREG